MARARSGAVAVALVALTVMLAGCIATPPAQLTSSERARMRVGLADAHWSAVTVEFPQANRPALIVQRTVDDHDWASTIATCLRTAGFAVELNADRTQYQVRRADAQIDFAIANYSCLIAYPAVGALVQFLDRDQIDALYLYYVASVRPCLLAAGVPSARPPSRFAFVTSVLTRQSWHPLQQAWAEQLPAAQLSYVEQLCQPVPKWLDLQTTAER